MPIIDPLPISGFKEFLPEEQIVLERMKRIIVKNFELYGFSPLESAAAEREEVLLAKSGENTKLIYGLRLLERSDQDVGDGKDIALRFDLTVPLARYVAQNYGKLAFPFRRYQIQKVWRGERAQKGRFREFYQCDIDVVGDGKLGLLSDAEIPAIIYSIFSEMQLGPFQIRINNRRVLNGLLEYLKIPLSYGDGQSTMNIIDKAEKVGIEKTKGMLVDLAGATNEAADALIEVLTFKASTDETLKWLSAKLYGELFEQGVRELSEVMNVVRVLGVPEESCVIDLGIARGLDYYTGTVYETTLLENPQFGSVCSGGRYDDLASNYIDRKLPGVGISIGLTRLLAALFDNGVVETGPSSPSQVIIFQMDPALRSDYFALAAQLRSSGIKTEVYPEDAKIDKQSKYAVKKKIPYGIYMDQKRKGDGVCTLRDYRADSESTMNFNETLTYLSS
ncbi:MAG: histidine--tRNA ligase [Candidatus Peribacteraceae bacterium]|nr:histidine--tRNA ligase [Candidatus Peribacteraceae bacterium]